MKKSLMLLGCGMLALSMTACGGSAEPEEPKEETKEVSKAKKDFDGSELSDTGAGTFYLVNQSGTTENGEPITVFADDDDLIIQIGYDTMDFDGSMLSYIYVDGMLQAKEQLGTSQMSLDLKEDMLSEGEHKVEIVQFEGDEEGGTVVTYKSACYEVKEK